MTDLTTDSPATADSWDGILANLRSRYPGQKDSILFCLFKLQSNPNLGLRDFREEAALHGIPMAGRALHSAKVLMGLATVKPRAKRTPPAEQPPSAASSSDASSGAPIARTRRLRAGVDTADGSIESKVLDAVRQIQSAATEEAGDLRQAIRAAITILQRAVGD